jgi:hypothetical protein
MLPTCRSTADEPTAVDPVDTVAHGIWQLETKEGFINLPCFVRLHPAESTLFVGDR